MSRFSSDPKRLVNFRTTLCGALIFSALALIGTIPAQAIEPIGIERAQGQTLSKAVGHWSRSRSYLLLALREFDKGGEEVDPDALIDAAVLRDEILEHIQVLGRLIDPQPRITEGGVRFEPAPALLGNEN